VGEHVVTPAAPGFESSFNPTFELGNRLFNHYCSTRVSPAPCKSTGSAQGASIKIQLTVPTPVEMMAGQYINIWLPSVTLWSWAQTHLFIITSWVYEAQGVMELLISPRKGQFAALSRQMNGVGTQASLSLLALYSGPHGISEPVSDYENIIIVAYGSGLAAVVPYIAMILKMMSIFRMITMLMTMILTTIVIFRKGQ
jgi:hypothetical protein